MTETKTITFAGFEIKDEAKGEVGAKIATLNVVDKDRDIIRSGALPKGAKAAMSRWGHDAVFGERPVGKGPLTEKDGDLTFAGRIFLKTTEGRETFETMKEMGVDQEWSFTFKILGWELPNEEEQKDGAIRIITKMAPISESLFEVSPVFAGAGVGTRTTSLKGEGAKLSDAQRAEIKTLVDEALAGATPGPESKVEDAAAAKAVAAAALAEAKAREEAERAAHEEENARVQAKMQEIFENFQRNMARRIA